MKKQTVLIVGSMAFDDLELPTTSAKNILGGAATYASFATSLFASARIVAVVGDDFSKQDLEMLQKRGIDTSGVEQVKGKTFRWAGRYSTNLTTRTTLDTQLNVFANFNPVLPSSYRSSDFVLLANIHPGLQLRVLDQVDKPKFVLADTMGFWIDGQPELLGKVLERVDVLCINDEEARMLSGVYALSLAAKRIMAKGPKCLIIKLGENGALLVDSEGMFWVPAVPVDDAMDPTGAGDAFAGAFVGYLASQQDCTPERMRQAMYVATAVASFNVQAIGTARLSRLSLEEVDKRVASLIGLTHLVPASVPLVGRG